MMDGHVADSSAPTDVSDNSRRLSKSASNVTRDDADSHFRVAAMPAPISHRRPAAASLDIAAGEQHAVEPKAQESHPPLRDRSSVVSDDDDEKSTSGSSSGTDVEIEARGIESDSDTESEKFEEDDDDDGSANRRRHHHHHHHDRANSVENSANLVATQFATHQSDRSSLSSSSVMPLINWDQHMADTDEARTLLDNDSLIGEGDSISNYGGPDHHSSHSFNPNVYSLTNEQLEYYTKYFVMNQPDPAQPLSGANARDFFCRSNLPQNELFVIWNAVDRGQKGHLLWEEFCVAMHLVVLRKHHYEIPDPLPTSLQSSVVRERRAILLAAIAALNDHQQGGSAEGSGEFFVSPPAEAPPSPPPAGALTAVTTEPTKPSENRKNFVRPADFDANFAPTTVSTHAPSAVESEQPSSNNSRAPRQRSHEPPPNVPPRAVGVADRHAAANLVANPAAVVSSGGGGHTRSASLDLNKLPLQLSPSTAAGDLQQQQAANSSPPAIPPRVVQQQVPSSSLAAAESNNNNNSMNQSAAKLKALSLSAAASKQYQAGISVMHQESPKSSPPRVAAELVGKRRVSNEKQQPNGNSALFSLTKPPRPSVDELRKMPIEALQALHGDYSAYLYALKRMNIDLSRQVLSTKQAVYENAARRRGESGGNVVDEG